MEFCKGKSGGLPCHRIAGHNGLCENEEEMAMGFMDILSDDFEAQEDEKIVIIRKIAGA